MNETLELLLDKFGEVAKGGQGIVMVVTPAADDTSHVVAIVRGSYEPAELDEICAELRKLAIDRVPSPFV
jgi:hypothetical protein